MLKKLPVLLQCDSAIIRKVKYTFDSLFMAKGIIPEYISEPPLSGIWLLYGQTKASSLPCERCLVIAHNPECWQFYYDDKPIDTIGYSEDLALVLPAKNVKFSEHLDIAFDLPANAFFFLSSWPERSKKNNDQTRQLYSNSIFTRFGIPQDIVDQYLNKLIGALNTVCKRLGVEPFETFAWPGNSNYSLVLSHDVDFIPTGLFDNAKQGLKTLLRHLVRQRDPIDAYRAAKGLITALIRNKDPYGCLPDIIKQEQELGVKASFQVAVGHRHSNDVNYFIEHDRTRDYLKCILHADFDLCLHGSYRSTEVIEWYIEEAKLLSDRLAKPTGSRQHFLAFNYDNLFTAQEQAGIEFDMSMGFPDQIGPRAGFSYPYYPYCLTEDRPYKVLELNLFLMDVTLRGYLNIKGEQAWDAIVSTLEDLREKRGCASIVWHPIVFGGARDPGFDQLFWRIIDYVRATSGLVTDGRTINNFWRELSKNYSSFNFEKV